MEHGDDSRIDVVQRLSASGGSMASVPIPISRHQSRYDASQLNAAPRGSFLSSSPGFGAAETSKRAGIPPAHPNASPASPFSQIPSPAARSLAGSFGFGHSRSLSQPALFSLDPLPPLPASASADAVEDRDAAAARQSGMARSGSGASARGVGGGGADGLPPRQAAHRRTQSDIPFAFSQLPFPAAGVPPPPPPMQRSPGLAKHEASDWDRDGESSAERRSERDRGGDDLFTSFMNLDGFESLNSSDDRREDPDSRASGTRMTGADSSDNEAESNVNESGRGAMNIRANQVMPTEKRECLKRNAAGDLPLAGAALRHCRSVSMDSFMEKLHFSDRSNGNSVDGAPSGFSLEFGNGEFSGSEMKKIMANDKLQKIAMADPKRAKRILANRQSAARSKERKMRYISELELKVQTLQTEATTLSAQLTLLQRDSAGLANQNNELKYCLQAMEQQAQLRDALNEALTKEVQRLKLAAGDGRASSGPDPRAFQFQQLQKPPQHQHQSVPSSTTAADIEK